MKKIIVATIIAIMLCVSFNLNVYAEGIKEDTYTVEEMYKYEAKEDGTIKITGVTEKFFEYYDGATILELPDEINGMEVTSILTRLNKIDTLKEIKLPKSMKVIGSHLFEDCVNLEKVTLPDNITLINEKAFYNCSNLKTIEMPESVIQIEDLAFAECRSLKKIELPANVKRLGENVFQNCTGLEEIKINNKLTVIKDNTFIGCTSLREMEIPKNITKIKTNAFKDCVSLTGITIKNSSITLEDKIFEGIPNLTIKSYNGSTASVYAEKYENINFEGIASEISQVEKAGWLMSAFANECATTYSNKFYYTASHPGRETYVFNYQNGEVGDSTLTLDCVGNLNLFIYQTTGLWSKNFAINNDPTYLTPQSGLKADDLFESEGYIQAKAFYNIAGAITEGKLHVGDLIQLDGHVAMYTGISSDGMVLCPENYSEHPSLTYKNFTSGSPSAWDSAGNIYRIKEEAANELTFLYELNTKEEVEAYGRKLAEAYMQGEAEYKGETLKRKNYGINKVTVGNKTEPVIGTETIDNVEIKTLKNIKGYTVKDIKALEMFAGYSKVEVLDEEGKVITNENEKMISTAMKVRLYKDITTGQALEIRAGGDTLQEEYVVIIYGDVTGAGKPSAIDALAIVKNATGKIKFNNKIKEIAGRVSKEARKNKTRPTAVDALMIVQEKLGKIEINQGEFTEQEPEVDETSDIIPIYTRADLEKVGSGEEWLVESVGKIYTMKTDAKYVLMKDIDLSEKEWTPIGMPEIKNESGEVIKEGTALTNTFEGNNHKITGLTITGEQETKDIGLFSVSQASINHLTLENVNIHNVTFSSTAKSVLDDEEESSTNSSIAGLVGCMLNNENEIILNRCKISGTVNPDIEANTEFEDDTEYTNIYIAGLVGYIYSDNENKYEIYNCENTANVYSGIKYDKYSEGFEQGNHFANRTRPYRIAGIISATNAELEVYNCKNSGEIQGDQGIAGIVADVSGNGITVYNCSNEGDLKARFYAGGIVGKAKTENFNNIVIYNCKNSGKVMNFENENLYFYSGAYCGGILGNLEGNYKNVKIFNCINSGELNEKHRSGGIIGYLSGKCENIQIDRCKSRNIIQGGNGLGGIAGIIDNSNYEKQSNIYITNCTNESEISSSHGNNVGGIAGYIFNITNINDDTIQPSILVIEDCNNIANITVSKDPRSNVKLEKIGGITGHIYSGESKIVNCINEGKIEIVNYINKGYNEAENEAGGIIGDDGSNSSEYMNCENKGEIIGYDRIGGIVGSISGMTGYTRKVLECTNSGNITGHIVGGIIGYISNEITYVENCSNKGNLSIENKLNKIWAYIGGIIGETGQGRYVIDGCTNSGKLPKPRSDYAEDKIGDMIGQEHIYN